MGTKKNRIEEEEHRNLNLENQMINEASRDHFSENFSMDWKFSPKFLTIHEARENFMVCKKVILGCSSHMIHIVQLELRT